MDARSTEQVTVPAAPPITLALTTAGVVSYAQANARLSALEAVTITNPGPMVRGASLTIEATDAFGSLGTPRTTLIDLAEKATVTLSDLSLFLDPATMLAVDEQRPGRITARLTAATDPATDPDAAPTTLAEASADVDVLAASQWRTTPVQLGMELLPAYVQPNAAAIQPLLHEGGELLEQRTGDRSMTGYQLEDPNRVDATVEAIYEAMRARRIRYAEPPASWSSTGQKVRTPAEVLEGRVGTCLDTTVVLAAALEQAGINSTLWIFDGHAFLGYWRHNSQLGSVVDFELGDLVNRVALGQLTLIETTAVTDSRDGDLDSAKSAARARLEASPSTYIGTIDVGAARSASIFPLPSRSIEPDGTVIVTEYRVAPRVAIREGRAAGATAAATASTGDTPGAATARRPTPPRVSQWKNSLLDLSLRNRLINFTDRAGYSLAVPSASLPLLEDQINSGISLSLRPSTAVSAVDRERKIQFGRDLPDETRAQLLEDRKEAYIDITDESYATKLRYLAYKAKTIVEETGANNLYLAFGMLHWSFNDRELKSPLILIPVTLTTANRGSLYRLSLDESGASTPNYCLLEKLSQAYDLSIPGLSDPVQDGAGIDLHAAFTAVRQAMLDAHLPFRVEDSVNLGILQFAKFRLWKDLDENWESLAGNPLVRHLIETPTEPFVDPMPPAAAENAPDLDALSAQCPVPADSSQLEAVAEAAQGRTFVLEGPPGTGKSQTITNLLAKALADGKRVLFVAEKRAALSVVQRRLDEIGLGPFSLDLHDKGARPAAVRAQIKSALEHRVTMDGAALSTNMEIANSNRRTLSRYAERLHEKNAAGLSLYSARTSELAADAFVPELPVPPGLVSGGTADDFDAVRVALRDLPETADYVRPQRVNPWGFVVDRPDAPITSTDAHSAAQNLDRAIAAALDAGVAADFIARATSPEQLADWSRIDGYQREPLTTIDAARDTVTPSAWNVAAQAVVDQVAALTQSPPAWLQQAQPEAVNLDIAGIHGEAIAADQSGFFGRKKRRRAVAAKLAPALRSPEAINLKHLSTFTGQIAETASQVNSLRAAAQQLAGVRIPADWNPLRPADAESVTSQITWLRWVGITIGLRPAEKPDAFTRDCRRLYETTQPDATRSQAVATVAETWAALIAAAHTTADNLTNWASDQGFFEAWAATRAGRNVDSPTPVTLDRWLAFTRALEPLRRRGMTDAVKALESGELSADDARLSFEKGLAAASVAERQQTTGLADFDPTAHNRSIERFTTSALAIRAELPNAIPAHVLALRSFDSSAPAGQVGLLRRQLERQRGGMSVRTLLDTFGELITQVLPITLMSPESVARFFPAKPGLFDVVVFDEASQIRVADAVGAMGRADSVVVVGDSKQMPPTSFGETALDADDEVELSAGVVEDEESILSECVQSQVPSKWLSWHYRSQDESLISFSNHHYYESRLSSFPAPLRATERSSLDGYGVSLVRVNATFNRAGKGKELRTNRIEAEAIVAEIRRRFDAAVALAGPSAEPADFEAPSLGVVTFNAQQRDFIENLLRDTGDERILNALDNDSERLFVKNLENVQGDERDTILFSIAFSVNEKGFLPLNFGPLQRAGGERRLNVAVTRARRQVLLFASFDPSELRAEQTSSVGVKHLKSYLEMAANGSDALEADPRRTAIFDRHRDDIAAELRLRGLAVKTDVGLSDFRVDLSIAPADEPDRPVLAVLLDGDSWKSRRTVADRDGLPIEVLKNLMHWPAVERVWLPEWLHDREAVLDRLELAIADVQAAAANGEQLARN
ncbi:DUF4011 domain-containing protein [Herbiconiux sp. KACC 21604]|uniref:DUF4011 domain-containing protein n=1 Tax=unclassified Herbiconiux TaxID=2618217 RepID=UPI001490F66A|nr:DUF4011 domain-containing protein [Herbiconiux sp. SALV-R1]QJU52787.1 DUF4011 domain-containing protein [Herbiconiux sp. SALV-R1]WPO87693.1 DUF4011 domain-containing protein [Herbiconiux sp. KACC 21604]